jgi:hypothetical protein
LGTYFTKLRIGQKLGIGGTKDAKKPEGIRPNKVAENLLMRIKTLAFFEVGVAKSFRIEGAT